MSKNKHTPGPWRWTAIPGGWDGVEHEDGPLLCRLVLNEPENARLMAASPDLLAALQLDLAFHSRPFARDSIDEFIAIGYSGPAKAPEMQHFLHELKLAAIEKATGGIE